MSRRAYGRDSEAHHAVRRHVLRENTSEVVLMVLNEPLQGDFGAALWLLPADYLPIGSNDWFC